MNQCNKCGGAVKPLFTGWYCASDCDLKVEDVETVKVWYYESLKYADYWDGRTCPDNGYGRWVFYDSYRETYKCFYIFSIKDVYSMNQRVILIKSGSVILESNDPRWVGNNGKV